MNRVRSAALVALALLAATAVAMPVAGQDLQAFEERTTLHTLENGWTFIIVERPVAPVFSFATIVEVGAAQEVTGITGLAHMFEHMAFKGTPTIGTTDFEAESEALAELEAAYQAWQAERLSRDPDEEELAELEEAFRQKQEAAADYVVTDEFSEIIQRAGGVGLNAFTNADFTGYFYSLPSNKVELFAHLESERFLHPVFREFYKERDVVQEERRLRTESTPIGRAIEQFVTTAYSAHPYKHPVVGYMSDLQAITITDAQEFYETHYVPANMVTAVVGDVEPETLVPLLDRYFGRIPAGPEPAPLRTVEPPQGAERTVVLKGQAQPIYLEAYHVGAATDPDAAVYDAINDILSRGRTSRLYRRLVRDEKRAVNVTSLTGFPGEKYPGLWLVFAIPTKGTTNHEVQASIREELRRLESEPVSAAELKKFRTRARADLIRALDSNQGLAFQLATYQQLFGDWRQLFRRLESYEEVTAEAIQRVARQTFEPANRTVAMIVTEEPQEAPTEDEAGSQPNAEDTESTGGQG